MKHKLLYSPLAQKDLDEIWDYIVSDPCNPIAAESTVNKIMDDIAWYTLAMMITDFGPLEDGGRERELSDGTLVTCPNCGEAFIRRNNRQQYCMKEECQKAHNALRQRRCRESQKIKKAQNKQK